MHSYANRQKNAAIRRIEFASATEGMLVFYHVADASAVPGIKQWLAQPTIGQTVLSETTLDGKPLLVACGGVPQDVLLEQLKQRGDYFIPQHEKQPLDPWVTRSILGTGGQLLQLASSFMRPLTPDPVTGLLRRRVDSSTLVFASTNLAANAINLFYKAQEVDDPNQLRYLKQQINNSLGSELSKGQGVLDPDDARAPLRGNQPKQDVASNLHGFMQRNSVKIGELGLRYLGAFGLVFPARSWGQALKNRTLPPFDASPLRVQAGLASIAGKTVAITSNIPDPYNPEPRSALDTFRDKYSFFTGGLIEAGAFSAYSYDALFNTGPGTAQKDRGISFRGKTHRDWLGGIGGAMFVAGYINRLWAKYGVRHVDMPELYAHTSDTLAKIPHEKLPQSLADTAARLAEHLKGHDGIDIATIYTQLANDLYRHHHVAITSAKPAKQDIAERNTPQTVIAQSDQIKAVRIQEQPAVLGRSNG